MLTIDTIPLNIGTQAASLRLARMVNTCRLAACVPTELFVLSVHPVAAAAATEFFKLKPSGRVLFIFCRHVIALFALGALQNYIISRHKTSSV